MHSIAIVLYSVFSWRLLYPPCFWRGKKKMSVDRPSNVERSNEILILAIIDNFSGDCIQTVCLYG